jgi:protein ImuA
MIPRGLSGACTDRASGDGSDGDRAAVLGRLRAALDARAVLPAPPLVFPLGAPEVDAALPGGGLAAGCLHAVVPAEPGDEPAALGFLAALLSLAAAARPGEGAGAPRGDVLLAGVRGAARPHGHGLAALGLDPDRLLLVALDGDAAVLWSLAEGLRGGLRAAAGLVSGPLGLAESRRLQLAAEAAGAVLVVLGPAGRPNAAATRWRIAAAPALLDEFGLLARPRWDVALERCRNGRPGRWLLEWDHAAHRFDLAPGLAGAAHPQGAARAVG